MALSDQWTVAQYISACRTELMDPNIRWWSDAAIREYVQEWIDQIQTRYSLTWGTATATATGTTAVDMTWANAADLTWESIADLTWATAQLPVATGTLTLSDAASDIGQLRYVWSANEQLTPTSIEELNMLAPLWRGDTPIVTPTAYYYNDAGSISFYPITGTNPVTVELEYVKDIPIGTDTSYVPDLPAWVRYSCIPYVAAIAWARPGPTNDLRKAMRYRARTERAMRRIGRILDKHLPQRAPRAKISGPYERDIRQVSRGATITP